MPIYESEWASIRTMCERVVAEMAGRKDSYFVTGPVIKRNVDKKLIWMAEFGDQPIPVTAFKSKVKYYDEDHLGNVKVKWANVVIEVPKIGATVLVVREMGSARLPRCLGEIQGIDWLISENE